MLLSEFSDRYILYIERKKKSPKTIRSTSDVLQKHIMPAIGHKDIADLKLTDDSYIIDLASKSGKYTAQRAIIVFRGLLKYIHDEGIPLPVHHSDYKVPVVPYKEVQYLTPEEREIIRHNININNREGLRLRTMFEFALRTGLRRGEITAVKIDDIDFLNHEIHVENIKTKEWQTVYTYGCEEWLKTYLASRKDKSPYLFVTANGARICDNLMKGVMTKLRKKVSTQIKKHLHWHLLRKTFCTEMLLNKIDLKTAQSLSRHSSEHTLLRHYAAVNKKHSKIEHERVMGVLN